MKKLLRRILMLVLALAFSASLMCVQASASKIASGTCGKGVKWSCPATAPSPYREKER